MAVRIGTESSGGGGGPTPPIYSLDITSIASLGTPAFIRSSIDNGTYDRTGVPSVSIVAQTSYTQKNALRLKTTGNPTRTVGGWLWPLVGVPTLPNTFRVEMDISGGGGSSGQQSALISPFCRFYTVATVSPGPVAEGFFFQQYAWQTQVDRRTAVPGATVMPVLNGSSAGGGTLAYAGNSYTNGLNTLTMLVERVPQTTPFAFRTTLNLYGGGLNANAPQRWAASNVSMALAPLAGKDLSSFGIGVFAFDETSDTYIDISRLEIYA